MAGSSLRRGRPELHFTFAHAVEKDPTCRAIISGHSPGVRCCADILEWLPLSADRDRLRKMDLNELRAEIIDQGMDLVFGGDDGAAFCFEDLHVAGPPCVDFSAMGLQRREHGPTRILFILWAHGLRLKRPCIVVFENVSRFPVALLKSVFDDLYDISFACIDAGDFGAPCKRLRLYAIMCLRRHCELT